MTTAALAADLDCIGIGFPRGTYSRWQLLGTGAPTLTDMGAGIAIATSGVLTLFIATSAKRWVVALLLAALACSA